MARSVELHLGLNGACFAGRWEQPASWARLASQLGFPWLELSTDLIDPFLCGDPHFLTEQARHLRAAAQEHGVGLVGVSAGLAPQRVHGLSHSDPIARQRMVEFVCQSMDLASAMGAPRVGGHWDAISTETLEQGEHAYHMAVRRQHEILRDLSQIGADKGLAGLTQDKSCVPSRTPCTFKQAEELLVEVNRGSAGCPVYLGLDVGQMAGQAYGLGGRDLDYREWLGQFAAFCEVIHLQQTTPDIICGWPFTEPYNTQGHIRLEEIVKAIQVSHAHAEESWVSEVLKPVQSTWLVLSVHCRTTVPEQRLLDDLRASAEYLKQYLPEGRLTVGG
jgi:hypothetical protein